MPSVAFPFTYSRTVRMSGTRNAMEGVPQRESSMIFVENLHKVYQTGDIAVRALKGDRKSVG